MSKDPYILQAIHEGLNLIAAHSIQNKTSDGIPFAWPGAKAIDWQEFRAQALYDYDSVDTSGLLDVCGVLDRALIRLGDRHSSLRYSGYENVMFRDYVLKNDPRNSPEFTWRRHKEYHRKDKRFLETGFLPASTETRSSSSLPTVMRLTDGLLHVTVPGFSSPDSQKQLEFQDIIRDGLLSAAEEHTSGAQHLRGVIVDLRGNGGGNMWPMIGGLSPLLGPEPLGFFRGPRRTEMSWRAGQDMPGLQLDRCDARNFPLINMPVAVLCGPKTCSSGEMTFLSFRGRPNTISFGDSTYGNSSSNTPHTVHLETPSGTATDLTLWICDGIALDRNYRGDGGKISPDHNISTDPLADAVQHLQSEASQPGIKRNHPPTFDL